jgi:ethanolamine ammonia-lyase large subunit
MLNYQSTSFHDVLYLRQSQNLRPAPEFQAWLEAARVFASPTRLAPADSGHPLLQLAAK